MKNKLVNILGMELREFTHKSCKAHIAEFKTTATIYDIESEEQGKGHATELLLAIKEYYQAKSIELWGSVALNETMKHLYNKLEINELN